MNEKTKYFEQLPENKLQAAHGDFSKCEGEWNLLDANLASRLLRSAIGVAEALGEPTPFGTERVEDVLRRIDEEGRVVHLPIGYMRSKNDFPKCPRCGQAIMSDVPALSRYDNKTAICSDCGQKEAFENFFGFVSD